MKKNREELYRLQRFQCHEETRPWEVFKDCFRLWGACLMFFVVFSIPAVMVIKNLT